MNETVQTAPAAAPAAVEATVATTEQPVQGAEAQQPQQGGLGGMLIPMLLLFGVAYFMMIRPQQRKEKERQKMISELRAGKRVVFAGGLIGTIAEAKEQTFVIELCPGTKVEVARAAVSSVVEEAAQPAK
ncbi:MAG: preprotein translocase subunit YajC [Candidatus Spyradenecus sp.]